MSTTRTQAVRLPNQVWDELKQLAKSKGTTVNGLVRQAIELALKEKQVSNISAPNPERLPSTPG